MDGSDAMRRFRLANTDLHLLRVFVTVARCEGFSAAQAELNVSQSTISKHISDLESRLGLTLCRRGRTGFALTPEGEEVLDACTTLFSRLEEFRTSVGSITGEFVGELVVAVNDANVTHDEFLLHKAIERFKGRGGDVQITLQLGPPNTIERMVIDGKAHLGIGFFPRRLPNLDYEPIFTSKIELFCGREHPLFESEPESLALEDVIAAPHARRGYVSLDQAPALHRQLNVQATASSMEGLAYLVLSNRFHAFLPTHLAARWIEQGQMRSLAPKTFAYTSQFDMIRRRSVPQTLVVKAFMEDIRVLAPLGRPAPRKRRPPRTPRQAALSAP
jgi:DNA-binding transcriptional LysR family regulator